MHYYTNLIPVLEQMKPGRKHLKSGDSKMTIKTKPQSTSETASELVINVWRLTNMNLEAFRTQHNCSRCFISSRNCLLRGEHASSFDNELELMWSKAKESQTHNKPIKKEELTASLPFIKPYVTMTTVSSSGSKCVFNRGEKNISMLYFRVK